MNILTNFDFELFRQWFLFYLKPLENFEFYFFNPLFWIILFLLFLLLLRVWQAKKSFQFCLLLAFILLCTTEIESRSAALFSSSELLFDAAIIKLVSIFVIIMLLMFYIFLS